jgi:hypothetical protein
VDDRVAAGAAMTSRRVETANAFENRFSWARG